MRKSTPSPPPPEYPLRISSKITLFSSTDPDTAAPGTDCSEAGRPPVPAVHPAWGDAPQGMRLLLRLRDHPRVHGHGHGAGPGIRASSSAAGPCDVQEEMGPVAVRHFHGGLFVCCLCVIHWSIGVLECSVFWCDVCIESV